MVWSLTNNHRFCTWCSLLVLELLCAEIYSQSISENDRIGPDYRVFVITDDSIETILDVRDPFILKFDTIRHSGSNVQTHFSTDKSSTCAISWKGTLVSVTQAELKTLLDQQLQIGHLAMSQLETVNCLDNYYSQDKRAVKRLLKKSDLSITQIIDESGCPGILPASDSQIVHRWLWQKKVEFELLDSGFEADLNVPQPLANSHDFWQALGILTKLRLEAFKSLLNFDGESALQTRLKQLRSSPHLYDCYKLAALRYCLYRYFPAELVDSQVKLHEVSISEEIFPDESFTLKFVRDLPKRASQVQFSTELMNFTGELVNLESIITGEIVLLDFWGTWCKPCLRDALTLDSLAEEMAQHNGQVISIAIDDEKKWRRYLDKKANSKVDHLLSNRQGESILLPSPRVFPTYVFINSEGNVITEVFHDIQKVEGYLERLLEADQRINHH